MEREAREAPDVALDDRQILRRIACRLRVIGAVAHPDLVHADMRGFGHVAGLAREQQEHAHRLAIGFGRHAGALGPVAAPAQDRAAHYRHPHQVLACGVSVSGGRHARSVRGVAMAAGDRSGLERLDAWLSQHEVKDAEAADAAAVTKSGKADTIRLGVGVYHVED